MVVVVVVVVVRMKEVGMGWTDLGWDVDRGGRGTYFFLHIRSNTGVTQMSQFRLEERNGII